MPEIIIPYLQNLQIPIAPDVTTVPKIIQKTTEAGAEKTLNALNPFHLDQKTIVNISGWFLGTVFITIGIIGLVFLAKDEIAKTAVKTLI